MDNCKRKKVVSKTIFKILESYYIYNNNHISLLLIYGVGFIDDLIGLDAKAKFTVQIMAASLLPLSGLYINNLYGFLGIHEVPTLL